MSLIYNSAYAIFYRQRKVFKTRNGDLANLSTESEVMSMKDHQDEALKLLKIALFLSLAIFTGAACKIKESP